MPGMARCSPVWFPTGLPVRSEPHVQAALSSVTRVQPILRVASALCPWQMRGSRDLWLTPRNHQGEAGSSVSALPLCLGRHRKLCQVSVSHSGGQGTWRTVRGQEGPRVVSNPFPTAPSPPGGSGSLEGGSPSPGEEHQTNHLLFWRQLGPKVSQAKQIPGDTRENRRQLAGKGVCEKGRHGWCGAC